MKSNKHLTKKQKKEVRNSLLGLKPQFVSLMCLSLMGTSLHANNNWTGTSGLSCNTDTCTISTSIPLGTSTITGTGNLKNLMITSSGIISKQGVSDVILIRNGTVGNLSNAGTIGSVGGYSVAGMGNSKIQTFENSGTIKTTGESAIGLWQSAAITILKNTGIIETSKINGRSVLLTDNSKIETIENLGTIKAGNGIAIGLWKNATIDALKNIGMIEANSEYSISLINSNRIQTIENSGTIKAVGESVISLWNSSVIDNLNNSGVILGNRHGIFMRGNSTISNFENSGIFKAGNGSGILLLKNTMIGNLNNSGTMESINENSVRLKENSRIQTINNSGTVIGNENGIYVQDNASIQNFTLNSSGILKATRGSGVSLTNSATINNINNDGTIESVSKDGIRLTGNSRVQTIENSRVIFGGRDGISAENTSNIQAINNSGTITGKEDGVHLQESSSIDNLNNTGTIQAIFGSGIDLSNSATINTLNNSKTIESMNEHGISLKDNSNIQTILNSGFISGYEDGIYAEGSISIDNLGNSGTIKATEGAGIALGGSTTLRNLNNTGTVESVTGSGMWLTDNSKIQTIESLGTITGETDGIHMQGNVILDSIDIKSNDKVEGKTGYGINIQGGASVTGNIVVSGGIKGGLGIIKNSGTLGGSIEIKNTANISATGGATPAIVNTGIVGNSIKNEGSQNFSLENQGHIKQGIINSGGATISVVNSGVVDKGISGYMVENTGSGKIQIRSWEVDNDEFGIPGELSVGGSGAQNVFVDTLVLDQGGLDLELLDTVDHFISGINHNSVKNVTTNGSGEIRLSYDPSTGKLGSSIDLNEGVAGVASRSFSHIHAQRLNFIDAVMSSSMQTLHHKNNTNALTLNHTNNLYADAKNLIQSDVLYNTSHARIENNSLFILPYFSSINIDLNSNQKSKGHTQGIILGYNMIKDSGIWGFYAGYEDTKTVDANYFNINARTYYTGLRYFNTIYHTQKGHEVYVKAGTNLGKVRNDLTKNIGVNNTAKAHPSSYVYGVSSDLGINLSYDKNIISPEIGLAYDGSYTQAFSMENVSGDALVKGGERYYANKMNVFSSRVSMSWFRDWLPKLKTAIQAGIKLNFNPQVKLKARLGKHVVDDHYDLPVNSKFTRTSLIVPLNDAFTFTVNYHGSFSNQGKNHSVYTQFNYFY